jgi:monoterpene epsilon-lactone hydrolase
MKQFREVYVPAFDKLGNVCPPIVGRNQAANAVIRQCDAKTFYTTAFYHDLRARYAVTITPDTIGGIYTEVFTPAAGSASKNKDRVLLNLHGGGFAFGSRVISHLESIPIAAVGQIKVISIDYRLAPEYTFPAASEDVAAVYRELLKHYRSENIGIYGCSAGGWLTAQSMAWFQHEHLPLPGAIGMFCAGANQVLGASTDKSLRSDAALVTAALNGRDLDKEPALEYYRGVNRRNPLASPGDYDEIMARFPPTLLISGTRDGLLSSVVVTHAQLVRLGVEAELHVWEGMDHAFFSQPALPESREVYQVVVKFFDAHLGR